MTEKLKQGIPENFVDSTVFEPDGFVGDLWDSEDVLDDRSATGKKRDWRQRKVNNEYLAIAYDQIDEHVAERLRSCANTLHFGVDADGKRRLVGTWFCRVRLCPICQWRRSLKLYSQMRKVMRYLEPQEYQYIFLTLTMQNVKLDELPGALENLILGFNRLTKYKEVSRVCQGWYRGVEITHNLDRDSGSYDTFHPHVHVVIAVRKSYFSDRYYLSQARWTELWQRALQVEYTPLVDIRKVKGATAKAVCEVTKYAAKSQDYIVLDDWDMTVETVKGLDVALHRRRLVGFGGCMKDARKVLELEDNESGDLVHVDEDDTYGEYEYFVSYSWRSGYCQYLKCSD